MPFACSFGADAALLRQRGHLLSQRCLRWRSKRVPRSQALGCLVCCCFFFSVALPEGLARFDGGGITRAVSDDASLLVTPD
jgi:hypothetical protein